MTIKIDPKMPLMVVDPLKGVALKRKEGSDLSFAGTERPDSRKETDAKGSPPQWEKGIFIDIYA